MHTTLDQSPLCDERQFLLPLCQKAQIQKGQENKKNECSDNCAIITALRRNKAQAWVNEALDDSVTKEQALPHGHVAIGKAKFWHGYTVVCSVIWKNGEKKYQVTYDPDPESALRRFNRLVEAYSNAH